MNSLRFLLFPLSLLFGTAVLVRNLLFNLHVLRSREFPLPVISVGNLAVGGMGKTPMTEYLVRLFEKDYTLATLNRGYKRKTKGFLLASEKDDAYSIGDEPAQIKAKFTSLMVAVDESRRRGISRLCSMNPELQVVILDDAYQHRWVKPGLSILVTDYHRLYTQDYLMPVGRLREPASGAKRAHIIVVNKTPRIFSPIVRRQILDELRATPVQTVCFSFIQYLEPVPLFDNEASRKVQLNDVYSILMVTGIVNPDPLNEHLRRLCKDLECITFRDHHDFKQADLEMIRNRFEMLPTRKKILVTTEKDALRLKGTASTSILKDLPVFYIPIQLEFHPKDKEAFDHAVQHYVTTNARISLKKTAEPLPQA